MEEDACAICLADPKLDPKVLEACGHSFCTPCILRFVHRAGGDTCPLCRAPMPDSADKLYIDALILIRQGERIPLTAAADAEIRRLLERAIDMDPHCIHALVTLGEMLSDEEPARAQKLLRTAIAESTEPIAPAHMALGLALRESGKFAEAVVEYRKTIKFAEGPGKTVIVANAHMSLAMTYERMGNFQQAFREYKVAMKVDPTDHLIPYNMGVTLERQNDIPNSIKAYKKVVALQPLFFDGNLALAGAYRRCVLGTASIDNTAGSERGNTAFQWLIASLGALATSNGPADRQACKEHIDKIVQDFPDVWATYNKLAAERKRALR